MSNVTANQLKFNELRDILTNYNGPITECPAYSEFSQLLVARYLSSKLHSIKSSEVIEQLVDDGVRLGISQSLEAISKVTHNVPNTPYTIGSGPWSRSIKAHVNSFKPNAAKTMHLCPGAHGKKININSKDWRLCRCRKFQSLRLGE